MSITVSVWAVGMIVLAAFWMGTLVSGIVWRRTARALLMSEKAQLQEKRIQESGEQSCFDTDQSRQPEGRAEHRGHNPFRELERSRTEKRIFLGQAVGSPVSGEASSFQEGGRKGVRILPEQGMLYAPVSGKIIKIYPCGNAFLLRTDSGVELFIQAGQETGELEGMYYRPRVVRNEIVNRGKLLLEFDREKLLAGGYDPSVIMSVEETGADRDITLTGAARVKNGEDILWVQQ